MTAGITDQKSAAISDPPRLTRITETDPRYRAAGKVHAAMMDLLMIREQLQAIREAVYGNDAGDDPRLSAETRLRAIGARIEPMDAMAYRAMLDLAKAFAEM